MVPIFRRSILNICVSIASLQQCVGQPAGCDLSNIEYADFLMRVRAFYKHGVFEFSTIEIVSKFLMSRETLLKTCAAAGLQAILLKLEENMAYEKRAHQELMAEYSRYFHLAVQEGGVVPRDLEEWPLLEGIERTLAINRALSDRQELTSAMVMNFCQPEDRFGERHELQWLLQAPFGDLDPSTPSTDVGLLKDTELFIYLVDAAWCTRPSEGLLTQLRRAVRHLHLIPYTGGPQREEQTAYFKFMVDHFDNLPDFVIFVHPDAPEHQGGSFPALTRALKLIRTQSAFAKGALGYYPLALQLIVDPMRTWGDEYANAWNTFWDRVFSPGWATYSLRQPHCRWVSHAGKFLGGLVAGAEDRQPRAAAKAACTATDECVGVTCGTPFQPDETKDLTVGKRYNTCTLRRGEPAGLHDSPVSQETSYVKYCAEQEHRSSQPVPVADQDQTERPQYSLHPASYLADYASFDSIEREVHAAKVRCNALGNQCGGVTCSAGGASCTVRAGTELYESPYGELTYKKEAVATGHKPEPAAALMAPPLAGANAYFQMYTGSQSVVSKDRILAWPKAELAALGADGPFCSEHSGLFEAVWHSMFGEPLSQWPRERDPRLPLYLKWGVSTLFSFGDEGVV